MRHQYLYLDPELIQAAPRRPRPPAPVQPAHPGDRRRRRGGHGLDALSPAGGAHPRGDRPRSLLRQPGGAEAGRPRRRGRPPAHHRRRAQHPPQRLRGDLLRPRPLRAGLPPHPAPPAKAIERLPETRPYKFGDDIHLLDSARSLQNAMRRTQGRRVQPRRGGPGGLRDRAPDLLRHGRRDRHQPLDDPLRRGPHHARRRPSRSPSPS